jgi:hypothetical protein
MNVWRIEQHQLVFLRDQRITWLEKLLVFNFFSTIVKNGIKSVFPKVTIVLEDPVIS